MTHYTSIDAGHRQWRLPTRRRYRDSSQVTHFQVPTDNDNQQAEPDQRSS